jgi:hypothetical protein
VAKSVRTVAKPVPTDNMAEIEQNLHSIMETYFDVSEDPKAERKLMNFGRAVFRYGAAHATKVFRQKDEGSTDEARAVRKARVMDMKEPT